jgi:hypothetical protein
MLLGELSLGWLPPRDAKGSLRGPATRAAYLQHHWQHAVLPNIWRVFKAD